MSARTIFVVVAMTSMLGVLGASSATASDHNYYYPRGFVLPCSLDGVNPAYHPDIFRNAAAARSYGFVRSTDGRWHVMPNCRR
jgi:hypothetical protein